jgi:hypothetical protein
MMLITRASGGKPIKQNPARILKGEPQPNPGILNKGPTIMNTNIKSGRRLKARPIFPHIVLVFVIAAPLCYWISVRLTLFQH